MTWLRKLPSGSGSGALRKSVLMCMHSNMNTAAAAGASGGDNDTDHPPLSFVATGWSKACASAVAEAEFAELGKRYPKRFNGRLQSNLEGVCVRPPCMHERCSYAATSMHPHSHLSWSHVIASPLIRFLRLYLDAD